MTLNDIMNRAASAYPDQWVLQYYDSNRQCAVDNQGGDGLARFIAWELYETYDPDTDDELQIETAIRKMRTAATDLNSVITDLENLQRERPNEA